MAREKIYFKMICPFSLALTKGGSTYAEEHDLLYNSGEYNEGIHDKEMDRVYFESKMINKTWHIRTQDVSILTNEDDCFLESL